MLRIAIRKYKTESWKNFIETINSNPWGLPYKIVMKKLRRSQGSSVPEDEKSLRKIVEVLFPTGEPRTSFLNQEHREEGEPFSPRAEGSGEQTITWQKPWTRRDSKRSGALDSKEESGDAHERL